jgi:hypothetical protein
MSWLKYILWNTNVVGGSKVDEVKEFATLVEAKEFAKNFNSKNTEASAPDWYMVAEVEGE